MLIFGVTPSDSAETAGRTADAKNSGEGPHVGVCAASELASWSQAATDAGVGAGVLWPANADLDLAATSQGGATHVLLPPGDYPWSMEAPKRVKACLAAGLTPISCFGFTLDQHSGGMALEGVAGTLNDLWSNLDPESQGKVVLAWNLPANPAEYASYDFYANDEAYAYWEKVARCSLDCQRAGTSMMDLEWGDDGPIFPTLSEAASALKFVSLQDGALDDPKLAFNFASWCF